MNAKAITAALASLLVGYGLGQFFPLRSAAPPLDSSAGLTPGQSGSSALPGISGQAVDTPALSIERRATLITTLLRVSQRDNVLQNQREVSALLAEIGPADIKAAVELIYQLKGDRFFGLQKLVSRWAELDPQAAANFSLTASFRQPGERIALVQCVATEWTKRDSKAARAWVAGMKDLSTMRAAATSVAAGLAESDPAAAFAWVNTLPTHARIASIYDQIFRFWAARDPGTAVREAQALAAGTARAQAFASALQQWSSQDPSAAVAWAQAMPEAGPRGEAIRIIFMIWAGADPSAAAAAAIALPPGPLRRFAVSNVIGSLAPKDLPAALKLAEELPAGVPRLDALASVGVTLAQDDPKKGVEFLASQPPSTRRDGYLKTAIAYWLDRAPDEAAEYIEQNFPPGEQRLEAIKPSAALEWMVKHGYTSSSELESPIQALATQDPARAMTWVQAETKGETRVKLENAVIASQAQTDTPAAMAAYEKLPPEQRLKDTAATIASHLAYRDPESAMRWASQLKDEDAQGAAYASLTTSWSYFDSAQVTGWLEKLPVGGNRDAAVSSFAKVAAESDPATAAAWAETIAEPTMRIVSLRNVFQTWKDRDQAGAAAWLATTPALDAAAKAAWSK